MGRTIAYLLSLCVGAVQADELVVVKGDVFRKHEQNRLERLTYEGSYREVSVSPNGKLVAIVKTTADQPELLVRQMPWGNPNTLALVSGRVKVGDYQIPPKGEVEWSNDSRLVYILFDCWGTSAYLVRLDVSTGELKGLCDAVSFSVVRSGKYKDKIITFKRKDTLVWPWYWYWLIDESGTEIGPIGERKDLVEFIDRYCDSRTRVP